MHTIEEDIAIAEKIAAAVEELGGCVYYVGGHVRDLFLGAENKDIDLEVHDIKEEQLQYILDQLGKRKSYGKSFGVYSLNHYGIDIAFPMNKQGERDPFISITDALSRRDFTMNAMAENVLTHEIIDPFHGKEDIKKHLIRAVKEDVFESDPLRVFRLASFYARTGFDIDSRTEELAQAADVSGLAKERVYAETVKALMKAVKPSLFFEELRKINQMEPWFTEVKNLIDIPQSPKYHPEGDVFSHTMMVIDNGASVRKQAEYPLDFLFSCLCHDFGKTISTSMKDGKIISYHHEDTGVPIAYAFLKRLTDSRDLIKYVENMIRMHMRPNNLAASAERGEKPGLKATNLMFDKSINPHDLILLSWCDQAGRCDPAVIEEYQTWLKERLAVYEKTVKKVIDGKDLMTLGYKSDSSFKDALAFARNQTLSMVAREAVLKRTDDYMKGLKKRHIMEESKGDNHA